MLSQVQMVIGAPDELFCIIRIHMTANSAVLTSPLTRPWVDMQASCGAPWIGSLDDPTAFLDERGWKVGLSQAGQPEANHGRWKLPVIPVTLPDMPHNWYVVAQKA